MQNYKKTTENVSEFLKSHDWTHFATFTTGYELTLRSARRAMHRIHDSIDRSAPCTMFWAAEPFDVREGYHTHALLKLPDHLTTKNVYDLWQVVCGKNAKHHRLDLKKYNPKRNATGYLSKYITKRLSDYDYLTPGSSVNYRFKRFR